MHIQYLNSLNSTTSGYRETPSFFFDEGIKGCIYLDSQGSQAVNARVRLIGTVSLDTTQTRSHYGALEMKRHPLDSKKILDISQDVFFTTNVAPFFIEIQPSSAGESPYPASLDVASSNLGGSFNPGVITFPYLIASVDYVLEVSIREDGVEYKCTNEIRLLPGASQAFSDLAVKDMLSQKVLWKRKLLSLKKSIAEKTTPGERLTVEASPVNALMFGSQSDAAVTKTSIKFLFQQDLDSEQTPPALKLSISWNLKSSTVLKITDHDVEQQDSTVVLHRRLPARSLQVTLSNWSREPSSTGNSSLWSYEHSFWITEPLKSRLTPTFCTSYLSQCYDLHVQIGIEEKGHLNARKGSIDFEIPVEVSYEQGTVPSYRSGSSPPEYICDSV